MDTPTPLSLEELYHSRFPREPGGGPTSKAAKAYAVALDIRKFEIELYWKRAAYFWVFTGAALAAYLAALTGQNVQSRAEALLLTSCIGLVFATAWYLVNRASKYWQLNWEIHVDLLEDCEVGPLYKTVMESNVSLKNLGGAYPFSVSKINQWLSLFIAVTFAMLVLRTITENYQIAKEWQWFPSLTLLMTAMSLAVLVVFGRVSSLDSKVRSKHRTTTIVP